MPRSRDRGAAQEAERRARAVQEVFGGRRRSAVARKYAVTAAQLREWEAQFVAAGEGAVTPHAADEQRWRRGGPGRRPQRAGKAMLAQLHVRVPKALQRQLVARARRLSEERGEEVSVPQLVREILERALKDG